MALLTVIIMAFNASAVAPVHSDIPNETSPCLNQDVGFTLDIRDFTRRRV